MLNIGAEGFCQCAVKSRYFITSLLLCKEEMKKEKKTLSCSEKWVTVVTHPGYLRIPLTVK